MRLVDVPDDPDDDVMVQANAPMLWLLNRQCRTAALRLSEGTEIPVVKLLRGLINDLAGKGWLTITIGGGHERDGDA